MPQGPAIAASLVATLIDATPERVRKRLDREPDVAAQWTWTQTGETWSIATGGEMVTLTGASLQTADHVRCTCLLSPRCFHVLACLARLEVAAVESGDATTEPPLHAESNDEKDDEILASDTQRIAAQDLVKSLAALLRVGAANGGVVMQSGLLRATHQCRAEGLHRLAAAGMRVIAGVRQLRDRSAESDPTQLAADIADILEASRHILMGKPIASFWIGTARRKQLPVKPRKLHGLFAEPILTRSGFAGAAAYFLGEDDRIYTSADVRPGQAQHARDGYHGGIEIGSLIQPVKQLARGLYLGADMTASLDGRLGRGKQIKIVEQSSASWSAESIQRRFRRSWAEQVHAVYDHVSLPEDARNAGWDFVFVEGQVLGALGSELLLQSDGVDRPLHLAIEYEHAEFRFRDNLLVLSHGPGLRLQCIARLRLQDPKVIYPLALAPVAGGSEVTLRLELPDAWAGRVCLGFDEMQRKHLIGARHAPLVLGEEVVPREVVDPLYPLQNRWIATLLSGFASQRLTSRNTVAAEMATLSRQGFTTAASLLDALTRSEEATTSTDSILATAIYLRQSRCELAKANL